MNKVDVNYNRFTFDVTPLAIGEVRVEVSLNDSDTMAIISNVKSLCPQIKERLICANLGRALKLFIEYDHRDMIHQLVCIGNLYQWEDPNRVEELINDLLMDIYKDIHLLARKLQEDRRYADEA